MKNPSPFDKEAEIHQRLLAFLKNQKKGLTTTDITKATGISRKTLEKHLQLLVAKNEISMKQYGPSRVYYPTIRVPTAAEQLTLDEKSLHFEVIETDSGKSLLIQERIRKDDQWLVKGSIALPLKNARDFAHALNKALAKIKNIK